MRVRCPHCRNPVEIVEESELSDIECPSCGSAIDLVADTITAVPEEQRLGHFQLIERLGMGAFGTVWKARDEELQRIVAVKIPRNTRMNREEAEWFLREGRAAAQLKHPGIVPVHEVGRDNGSPYIVSDFVDGVDLSAWQQAKTINARESAELIAEIADALHHAHECGVIHRDLKPSNVMLDGKGRPHLMDFGLAKRDAGEITMTVDGRTLGTPAYMPPEQARGEGHHVDRRADIYSLGVMLFELLTGERPFRGNVRMLLHQVIHDEPPSPRKLNGRTPRDLETICLKCLEKDKSRRYATAQDLAADLRRFLEGHPIHARPLGSLARTSRWCRRNPLLTALFVSLLAGIAGSLSLGWVAMIQRDAAHAHAAAAARESAAATANAQRAEANLAQAWENLYTARMNQFQLAWDSGQATHARRVLESLKEPPQGMRDLRGWEWQFANRLTHQEQYDGLVAPAIGGAGYLDEEGEIIVLRREPKTAKTFVSRVQLADGNIREAYELERGDSRYNSIRLAPSGRWIVDHRKKSLDIRDARDGSQVASLEVVPTSPFAAGLSDDGKRVAISIRSSAQVLDTETGRTVLDYPLDHAAPWTVLSPNGKRLALTTGKAGDTLKIVAVDDGSLLYEVTLPREVAGNAFSSIRYLTFSPDGNQLGFVRDRRVYLVDLRDEPTMKQVGEHARNVQAVAISPDGKQMATAGFDQIIRLWDIASGRVLRRFIGHESTVFTLLFSGDGRLLISLGTSEIKTWDVGWDAEQQMLADHGWAVRSVAFSPDGRHLVSSSQTVHYWDYLLGAQRKFSPGSSTVFDADFGPQGDWVTSVAVDRSLCVWDVAAMQPTWKKVFENDAQGVAVHPNGNVIATVTGDSFLHIARAEDGKLLEKLPCEALGSSIAFSPDGQLLAVAGNGKIQFWSTEQWTESHAINLPAEAITNFAFSPDGSMLASVSAIEPTVRIWDVNRSEEVRSFQGTGKVHWSIAWHPDGSRLATGNGNGTVTIWDAESGEIRLTMSYVSEFNGPTKSVAFSHDGHFLAASGGLKIVVWDARPWTEAIRVERTAAGRIRHGRARGQDARQILQQVQRDATASPAERERVAKLLRSATVRQP